MTSNLAGDVLPFESISQRVDQLSGITDEGRRIRLGVCAAVENPLGAWLPGPLLAHVVRLGDVDASVTEREFLQLLSQMCGEELLATNGERFFKFGLTWVPPEGLEVPARS
jgi:hypothetical protein